MKTVGTVFLLFVAITISACAKKQADLTVGSDAKKAERRVPPLFLEAASKYQLAAAQVAAVLKEEGEDPVEFHADVVEREGGAFLVFQLTHKNTFLPENRNTFGNPSGKDREIVFDARTGKTSRSLFYQ